MSNPGTPATSSTLDASYFSDAEELTKTLTDKRATDTQMRSSFADAQAIVTAFAAETSAGAWSTTLSRADVAARLTAIVTPPTDDTNPPTTGTRIFRQGKMNLCGPAAFFQMAAGRDPVAVMKFATQLFDSGTATVGNLTVTPGQDLLQADFNAMLQKAGTNVFAAADWMLFGALRNSTDVFWQGSWGGDPTQLVAAMTRPEELAGWMRDSGIWSSVDDHGKWASNPGILNAANLTMPTGTDIPLLINANLIAKATLWNPTAGAADASPPVASPPIDNTFLLSSFPNHWVVLLAEIIPDTTQQNVLLTIWTWGARYYLSVPNQVFVDNYYGAIVGQAAAAAAAPAADPAPSS
jgi:hypothetical protein